MPPEIMVANRLICNHDLRRHAERNGDKEHLMHQYGTQWPQCLGCDLHVAWAVLLCN
jgi:hypothetical protein